MIPEKTELIGLTRALILQRDFLKRPLVAQRIRLAGDQTHLKMVSRFSSVRRILAVPILASSYLCQHLESLRRC